VVLEVAVTAQKTVQTVQQDQLTPEVVEVVTVVVLQVIHRLDMEQQVVLAL
jgi:hypothetical protein